MKKKMNKNTTNKPSLIRSNEKGLEIRRVSKSYNNRPVVREVSFQINKGEAVGLLGPNGSGKTTLFNSIVGTYPIDCLLYTSPSPRDRTRSRMPSSA